ncbi:MAG: hypothetical protein IKM39_01050 [Clostridia bacterium]|nr:hypothetical protein [Clostridia bacterium]
MNLITTRNVSLFYIETHGNFDKIVYSVLNELRQSYSFQILVVLAYLPTNQTGFPPDITIYPEGIEKISYRYAIIWRNRWMLDHADFVVTHTKTTTGGAQMMKDLARKKNKTVIEI